MVQRGTAADQQITAVGVGDGQLTVGVSEQMHRVVPGNPPPRLRVVDRWCAQRECDHRADGLVVGHSVPHYGHLSFCQWWSAWVIAACSSKRRSAEPIMDRAAGTASGFTEIEVIPWRTRYSANTGRLDGACPHSDDVIPASEHAWMIRAIMSSTAGPDSSNSSAQTSESRSTPSTSWVRSLLPIDTPSIPSLAYAGIQ